MQPMWTAWIENRSVFNVCVCVFVFLSSSLTTNGLTTNGTEVIKALMLYTCSVDGMLRSCCKIPSFIPFDLAENFHFAHNFKIELSGFQMRW